MDIAFHRDFKKKYKKLKNFEQNKFKERKDLFFEEPFHPLLNNHSLSDKYKDCRSINIIGDIRAIYKIIGKTAIFIVIGSHPQLYS